MSIIKILRMCWRGMGLELFSKLHWKLFKVVLFLKSMKKESLTILAQILSSMKDGAGKLEEAEKNKDLETYNNLKNEILLLQRKIDEILKNDKWVKKEYRSWNRYN